MDLMKAFEKIESTWIISVLLALNTPTWFVNYTKWVLMKGRTSTPRITGQLLPPLQMQRGVDMGRACSVLLFCCAIDPFLRKLQVLDLQVKRAYMDDTTLGTFKKADIKRIQEIFLTFKHTGLQSIQHECCKIKVIKNNNSSIISTASWTMSARHALQQKNSRFEIKDVHKQGTYSKVSRNTIIKLAHQQAPKLLTKLLNIPCNCKCKTTLITAKQLSPQQLHYFDNTPFGAHIVKTMDTTLGLLLHCKSYLLQNSNVPRTILKKNKALAKPNQKKKKENTETQIKTSK